MRPNVSVVMCIRNIEQYIANCLNALFDQTFQNFEIVLIDDFSDDDSEKVIKQFNDARIKYFKNAEWLGITRSRNAGVKHASGEYIFFTDGDCTVTKNWIEEGLKSLRTPNCIAVEGKIIYVSKNYEPTFSDHVMENRSGGAFMTGSMAYKRSVFESLGGFDVRYTYLEDRDLGLRAMKIGKIVFNPNMVAYHPKYVMKPKQFVKWSEKVKNRILLYKRFGEKFEMLGKIVLPLELITIIFPPLIVGSLVKNRFRTKDDYALFPFLYLQLIRKRIHIWSICIKERVFLI